MSFILLGHQRSGSSYLLDVIRHHPSVDTINQPFSGHLDFFREDETFWSEESYEEEILHKSLENLPETINYIKGLDRWLNFPFPNIRGFKEIILFEKYWWLKKAMSLDKVIILVRDPRAVIASVLKRNMHTSWWDYNGKLTKYYNNSADDIELSSPHMICASVWKHRMNHVQKIIEMEDNFLVTRLEDVTINPELEIKRIMEFLEFDIHHDQIEFIKETSKETRNSTYSNFRKREDVLYAWKSEIKGKKQAMVEEYLSKELRFFNYQ